LDSSWLAGDDNDQGKLLLSRDQIDLLSTGRNGEALDGFRVALVHHPVAHLADAASTWRVLADNVDLLLHGHQHEEAVGNQLDPDRRLRVIAAGSLFEGDEGDEWINAFHRIDVTLSSTGRPVRYEITFYGWSPNGHWYRTGAIYRHAPGGVLVWHVLEAATTDELRKLLDDANEFQVSLAEISRRLHAGIELVPLLGALCEYVRSHAPWQEHVVSSGVAPDVQSVLQAIARANKGPLVENGFRADLHNVDISGANLEDANLEEVVLWGSNLCRVNFARAKMCRANLDGCDLKEASFEFADLSGATFGVSDPFPPRRTASLRGAKMWKADLTSADLRLADLRDADGLTLDQLQSAVVDHTMLMHKQRALAPTVK
jgi:uncharacterized protein YjbI with pentapeptide repeats